MNEATILHEFSTMGKSADLAHRTDKQLHVVRASS